MKRSFAKSMRFESNRKRICQGKLHKLNETMYLWHAKFCAANLHPTGALIQEKAYVDERENDTN